MVKFEQFEVFESETSGRGLRATSNVKAGEEILKEKPLVYTLMNAKCRGIRCDYCFGEADKLFKCSKCKYVAYCGRDCQAGDWSIHKHECKCLVKVAPKQPPDICRLVCHLLFKYYTPRKNESMPDASDIERLIDNRDHITNARKEAFFTFSGVLYDYLYGCTFTDDTDIYGLLCRISCNSFTITNFEMNSLGTGLYKTASLINHSCDPNVVAMFDGPDISLRTIRDVGEGEEFVLSYVNLLATTQIRQMELKDGYMFTCSCSKCTGQSIGDFLMMSIKCDKCPCFQSLHEESDKTCSCDKKCEKTIGHFNKASNCMDSLEAHYNEINIIPNIEQQKKMELKVRKATQLLGHCNISLLHAYEVLMDGCLDRNDWKGALEYSKKLEKLYLVYLSKYHPTNGLHYFKQGKLEMQVDNLREGINCFEKSLKILSISHGENHSLVKMLKENLDGACREMSEREHFIHLENVKTEMEDD